MLRWVTLASIVLSCSAQPTCTNPVPKIVSETAKGHGTTEVHVAGGHGAPAVDMKITQNISYSIDVELMNIKEVIQQTVEVVGTPTKMKQEIGFILNWEARTMTQLIKFYPSSDPHQPVPASSCKTTKFPLMPPRFLLRKLSALMAKGYKCVGHHDDVDVFGLDFGFPPKWFPVSLPAGIQLHIVLEQDKAGLVRSEKMNENLKMKGRETKLSMNMVFPESSLGGPSDADLVVPESWGCPKASEDTKEEDLEAILDQWESERSPFLGHHRLIPHALRSFMKSSAEIHV